MVGALCHPSLHCGHSTNHAVVEGYDNRPLPSFGLRQRVARHIVNMVASVTPAWTPIPHTAPTKQVAVIPDLHQTGLSL